MSEESKQGDAQPEMSFEEFEKWRETGERPAQESEPAGGEPEEGKRAQPESEPEKDEDRDEEDGEEPRPKGKGGFQRRIDRLTREKHELAQRLAAVEQRLAGPPAGARPEGTPPEGAPAGKPRVEDFTDYEEYVEALTDWKLEQRETAARQAQAETQAREQAKQLQSNWDRAQEALRAEVEDYDDVLGAADMPITQAVHRALLESEQGPRLAYHFARHPEELERIQALSPVAQVREIGKLEAKLTPAAAPDPAKKTKASSAPPPPTPVRGKAKAVDLGDPNVDYATWEKARNAQLAE